MTDDAAGETPPTRDRLATVPPAVVAAAATVGVFTEHFAQRTAAKDAAFFRLYARAGMRFLDCGCGPGTISVGFARAIAPGELIGIDTDDRHLGLARDHVRDLGLTNVRFERADIHSLPYDAGSFDAAMVSRLLEHVPDPVAAMREVRRVLVPGGIVGVCSPDYGGTIIAPVDPLLERWVALHRAWRENRGGNPLMGRFLRATLVEAGFARVVASVSEEYYGDADSTRAFGDRVAREILGNAWGGEVCAADLADRGTLNEIATAVGRTWGERPGALYATPHGEAVGWAP